MNEIVIDRQDFDYVVKKQDVWIVYLKNGKHWVCRINGLVYDKESITLKLATKGKSDKNG